MVKKKTKKPCNHIDKNGKSQWRMLYRLSNIAVYQCKKCKKEMRKTDVV